MLLKPYLQVIIDGYNFLMTTGMMGTQVADIELEKGRRRLLKFLADEFRESDERKKIVVVFDSSTTLRLPTSLTVKNIGVKFAKGYENADELIIDMVRANHSPKQLLVVTSDHEIQTAAKRRKAHFIDSDVWLDQIESVKDRQESDPQTEPDKTADDDAEYWLNVFDPSEINELFERESNQAPSHTPTDNDADEKPASPSERNPKNKDKTQREELSDDHSEMEMDELLGTKDSSDEISKDDFSDFDDIFPPGYGEDLLE